MYQLFFVGKVYLIAGYMYNEISLVPNYDPSYGVQVGCKEGIVFCSTSFS